MKLVISIQIFLIIGCSQTNTRRDLISRNSHTLTIPQGSYLGQQAPGMTPKKFAPKIITTEESELNSVFSSDRDQFYFSRKVNGVYQVLLTKQIENEWTKPEMVNFSKNNPEMEALDLILSQDEKRLYFISNRPSLFFKDKSVNIWVSNWDGENWSDPLVLPPPVNTNFDESYPFFVADGSIYFASNREGGFGDKDVYRAQFNNGVFETPQNLGSAVNTEFGEGDTYVSPDESFLIVNSWGRPDSRGGGDLYISLRNLDGTWGKPVNMGEPINSELSDYCPIVSPDRKYFFFTRNRDIYWVDAKIIDRYKN